MKPNYFEQDNADENDTLLGMAKMQGYVPGTCLLGGVTVMGMVAKSTKPCKGCNGPRDKCKGENIMNLTEKEKSQGLEISEGDIRLVPAGKDYKGLYIHAYSNELKQSGLPEASIDCKLQQAFAGVSGDIQWSDLPKLRIAKSREHFKVSMMEFIPETGKHAAPAIKDSGGGELCIGDIVEFNSVKYFIAYRYGECVLKQPNSIHYISVNKDAKLIKLSECWSTDDFVICGYDDEPLYGRVKHLLNIN